MNKTPIVVGHNDVLNHCLKCREPMPVEAVALYCTSCIAHAGGTFKLNAEAL